MRTESRDFETWGGTTEALTREPGDPPNWSPSHGIDLAGVLYTGDLYVGFVDTVYSHMVEDVDPRCGASTAASSRSTGRSWWSAGTASGGGGRRLSSSSCGRGCTMRGTATTLRCTSPSSRTTAVYVYYSGGSVANNANDPGHPQHDWGRREADRRRDHEAGRVRVAGRLRGPIRPSRRGRCGSRATGWRSTSARPTRRRTGLGPTGGFAVEVLDANSSAASGLLAAGLRRHSPATTCAMSVTWNGSHHLAGLEGLPVRLRFHLDNAALYSFRFRGESDPPPAANAEEPGSRGFP